MADELVRGATERLQQQGRDWNADSLERERTLPLGHDDLIVLLTELDITCGVCTMNLDGQLRFCS